MTVDPATDLKAQVASRLWYHTIDLAPGITTPGWFDLRPIVDRMPWPEVAGRRCLDVGTYDGFLAFELERRGAAEVVAVDVEDHNDWDWPPDVRATGGENLARLAGPEKSGGFRIAKEALGSSVKLQQTSVYDLDPATIGMFDVVVCGTLLLHLRDPLRALEAIRSVCSGSFLSAEQIELELSLLHRKTALARLNGSGELCQWWAPNVAGHRRMVFAAGFAIDKAVRPYTVPYGVSHPKPGRTWPALRRRVVESVAANGPGVPHSAVLASPRV
jgi:tRNA (mo5U34)-methyltransferase